MEDKIKGLYELDEKIAALVYSMNLISWDGQTTAPKESVNGRAKAMMILSDTYFTTLINGETDALLSALEGRAEALSQEDRVKVKFYRKEYDQIAKIPQKEYAAFSEARSLASAAWEEAKNADDYNIFAPHLEKMITMTKKQVDYMGKDARRYDVLLDRYEEGLTIEILDDFFEYLKSEIVPLVEAIKESGLNEKYTALDKDLDVESQKDMVNDILERIGFNLDRGMIGESEHPFTCNMNRDDVRFSVHYYKHDFRSAYLSAYHEGGHALYEQDIDEKLAYSMLGTGTSMGIHESQSRFYENHIALCTEQLEHLYHQIKTYYKPELEKMSFEQFNFEMNKVKASLIRVEADEVTYPLHVMIRYEMEKMMIEEDVDVYELPKLWNEKYEQYLGIKPPSDQVGILQDVHWSEALFGYFPSYALGSAYSAQFYNKMSDTVDIIGDIKAGNLDNISKWLKENIHTFGCLKNPDEIIQLATGEAFNPKYYTDYIKAKYKKLYQLK